MFPVYGLQSTVYPDMSGGCPARPTFSRYATRLAGVFKSPGFLTKTLIRVLSFFPSIHGSFTLKRGSLSYRKLRRKREGGKEESKVRVRKEQGRKGKKEAG
jgi:hypothetical protein